MYTVSKGPSKIVAKTRRGLTQNYEKFETIKESSRRTSDLYSPEKNHIPRPVFQAMKKSSTHTKQVEEEVITPQHEEIINYINDSWNHIVAHNPYDTTCLRNSRASPATTTQTDSNNNSVATSASTSSAPSSASSSVSSSSSACSSTSISPVQSPQPTTTTTTTTTTNGASFYCVEPPSPVLSDFKPFDLESWWGRRLFNNITTSLYCN